ncbi:hypothetical protein L2764_01905 [Shewanella surugensis]|uniref:Uncharacterized protein n=1 Tax=Shewanella surugensis TaxID=212020 RepID=A0ABT0L7A4_9GAMM|nr:hypothetical protein [Shewanella surugensis]
MKLIYGALPFREGKITIDDIPVNLTSPNKSLQAGLVYISEDRKGDGLILSLSVRDNMSLSALKMLSHFSGHIHLSVEHDLIRYYIDTFNIKTPSLQQDVGHLSGG